jgi:ESS family glutamate:Na+ symporter
MNEVILEDFVSLTIGMLVLFSGVSLTRRSKFLREFNIPEPVTGGLLAALVIFAIYLITDLEVSFDLSTRDRLLVYFFTAIGLNARFEDLVKGGKPLLILLILTVSYIAIQNLVGIGGAILVGLEHSVGVLAGSVSLIGGHGTAIAWAPDIVELGISNALEIGIASATLGLIIASLIGGPIARYLIKRHQLQADPDEAHLVGLSHATEQTEKVNHLSLMAVLLTLHIAIIIGYLVNEFISELGFKLPLFVSCLLTAILLSNIVPKVLPKMRWPARTRALAIVSEFSLGLFLAMSLMSMQLWTIAGLAGPLLFILLLQTCAAVLFILLILFPLMGRDYQAAVLSAGFGGFAMGATPTAIANMTAVTKSHGPAATAFIILPLVAAFFVDIANAFIIRFALTL